MSRQHEETKDEPKLGARLAQRAADGAATREAEAEEPTLDQRVTAIETWFHDNGYTLPPAIPPEEPEPKEPEAEEAAAKEAEAQERSAQERLAQERSAQTRAAETRAAEPRPMEPPEKEAAA